MQRQNTSVCYLFKQNKPPRTKQKFKLVQAISTKYLTLAYVIMWYTKSSTKNEENLTGTAMAYAPAGSIRRGAPAERRDYEAWSPE